MNLPSLESNSETGSVELLQTQSNLKCVLVLRVMVIWLCVVYSLQIDWEVLRLRLLQSFALILGAVSHMTHKKERGHRNRVERHKLILARVEIITNQGTDLTKKHLWCKIYKADVCRDLKHNHQDNGKVRTRRKQEWCNQTYYTDPASLSLFCLLKYKQNGSTKQQWLP